MTQSPTPRRAPQVFVLDSASTLTPATAPPIADPDITPTQTVPSATERQRKISLIWPVGMALLGLMVSVTLWDFTTSLMARNALLGTLALGLTGLLAILFLLALLRESAALLRMRKLDDLRGQIIQARATAPDQMAAPQTAVAALRGLYAHRADCAWGLARLAEHQTGLMDGDALLDLAENEVLTPLDAQATQAIETAARQVATITAFVPLALADLAAVLFVNLRLIRRIAQIYGGRTGWLGSWRLIRRIMVHLAATGAMAVGDDVIQSVLGGNLLAKLSRRFGEGIVNAALSARVGVAAMELCRPMPFAASPRPRVSALVTRALAGVFTHS